MVLAGSLAVPFLLSFDKKVAFYKKWKYLFRALFFPAVFYIIWDSQFTSMGIWSFNENYITGIHLLNLPLEEVLFFFVVPYCCLFIYECVINYFPKIKTTLLADRFFLILGMLLCVAGIFHHDKWYTTVTAILCGIALISINRIPSVKKYFNSSAFFISYLIILIPFLIVNGILTAIPVVLYNDNENVGVRLYTIPIEDIFYGMLLLLLTIIPYEKLKQRKRSV